MTTIHAELVGDTVVLSRLDLERLLELARQSEAVEIVTRQERTPAAGLAMLAEQGGAFAFLADEEDLYTVDDLKARF